MSAWVIASAFVSGASFASAAWCFALSRQRRLDEQPVDDEPPPLKPMTPGDWEYRFRLDPTARRAFGGHTPPDRSTP